MEAYKSFTLDYSVVICCLANIKPISSVCPYPAQHVWSTFPVAAVFLPCK